jgi:hypothetical protein
MQRMDTKNQATEDPGPVLNPLTGWEAASRWNSAAFELMTKGFQQWLTLVTNSFVTPNSNLTRVPPLVSAKTSHAAAAEGDHAKPSRPRASDAKARPKRPARPKAAGARKSRRV